MRKEGIFYCCKGKGLQLVGYEILARAPHLITDKEKDFLNFKRLLTKIKNIDDSLTYYINLMPVTLQHFSNEIIETLDKLKMKEKVVIELTEKPIQEFEKLSKKIGEGGIKISIDDFGTESANLDRIIKSIDFIESIKIDKVVWKNFTEVVKGLVESELLKKSNIKIIAEKVETEEELKKLISIGVKYFQGWYFKKM